MARWPDWSPRSTPRRAREPEQRRATARRRRRPAALVLALAAALALFARGLGPLTAPSDPPAPAVDVVEIVALSEDLARIAGQLEEALAEREQDLSPQTADVLRENLRIVDDAVAVTRQAMAEEPNSPVAQQALVAALERRVDLLRRANEVAVAEGVR